MDITNEQWAVIEPLLPAPPAHKGNKGRKRKPDRDVLNGMLWVLRTGAQWSELPKRYPPYQTCHRRFQEWVRQRAFQKILRVLAQRMQRKGSMNLAECYIDGTFASAKKGGHASGRQNAEKARR